MSEETITLKVGRKTEVPKCAGAIAHNVREGKLVHIVAMGAEAVNQTVKSIAVARRNLVDDKKDIFCQPELIQIKAEGEGESKDRNAIRFVLSVEALQ